MTLGRSLNITGLDKFKILKSFSPLNLIMIHAEMKVGGEKVGREKMKVGREARRKNFILYHHGDMKFKNRQI